MTSHTDFLQDVENLRIKFASVQNLLKEVYSYISHDTPASDAMLQRISGMKADNHTFEERREWATMVLKLRKALGISVPETVQCCPRDHDKDGNCDRHPEGIKLSDEDRKHIYEMGKQISQRRLGEVSNSEIIAMINVHQSNPNVHPLTCGKDSNHTPLLPMELEGRVVLACKDCDYIQKHIPPLFPKENDE